MFDNGKKKLGKFVSSLLFGDSKCEDFELLACLDDEGNLKLDAKVLEHWVCCEDSVQHEVVVISTVGDQGSGKSTTLDNIQDYLQGLKGNKPKNFRNDTSYYFPRSHNAAKHEALKGKNGILLKTKPYMIENGTKTVAVFPMDIWTTPNPGLDQKAYTKLVDFCLSVSSVVVWTRTQREQHTRWSSPRYDKDESILRLLPAKILSRITFCFYNWPYEEGKNIKSRVLYQFGKVGHTVFANYSSDPENLPITAETVHFAVDVGNSFQDVIYFCCTKKDARDKQEILFARDGLQQVLKPNCFKPVYGSTGNRVAEDIKELVMQVVHAIYDPTSAKESSAFNFRKLKLSGQVMKGGQNVEDRLVKSNRPAENTVKEHVTGAYLEALASLVPTKNEKNLLFSEESFTDYHHAATDAALDSFAKRFPKSVDEKMCDVIEKQIVLVVEQVLELRSEIEAVLQEAETGIASYIILVSPKTNVKNHLDACLKLLAGIVHGFKHSSLIEKAKEFSSFKLGTLNRAYDFVSKYESYMRQLVQQKICLDPDELYAHHLRSYELSLEQTEFGNRRNPSASLKSFVESTVERIYESLKKENESFIQQENVLAKDAAVVALNAYQRGMETTIGKSILSLADLHKLHENMSSFILDAYDNLPNFTYTFVWIAAKENLRMQLQNEFPVFHQKNLLNFNRSEICRKEICDRAFNLFKNRMTADHLEKSANKRKLNYLEARQLALESFQDQVSHQPGELVKYWKANLTDAMERYKASTDPNMSEKLVQSIPKRLPPAHIRRASAAILIDEKDVHLGVLFSESQDMNVSIMASPDCPPLFHLIEGRLELADPTESIENRLASCFTRLKVGVEKNLNVSVDFWTIIVSASISCGGKRRLKNGLLVAGIPRHRIIYTTTALALSYYLGRCGVPKSVGQHFILVVHRNATTMEFAFCELDETRMYVRRVLSMENDQGDLKNLIVRLLFTPEFCCEAPRKILISTAQPELYSNAQLIEGLAECIEDKISLHAINELNGTWSGSFGLCESLGKHEHVSYFEASPYEVVIQKGGDETTVVCANQLLSGTAVLAHNFAKTEQPILIQRSGNFSHEIGRIIPNNFPCAGVLTRSRSMITMNIAVDVEGIVSVQLRNSQNQSIAFSCPNSLLLFDLKPPGTMMQENPAQADTTLTYLQSVELSEDGQTEIPIKQEVRTPIVPVEERRDLAPPVESLTQYQNPLKKELEEKIARIRAKLEVSKTPGPVKNHIKKRVDAASLLLQETDVTDAKLKQAIDGLNASEEAIKN